MWSRFKTPEQGTFESRLSGPRHTVAHHAGAKVLDPQPDGAPTAVGMATGIVTTTPTIALTRSGKAFAALRTGGMARSRDGGTTWEIVRPPDSGGDTHTGGEHGYVVVDRDTDRVYYVTWMHVESFGERRRSISGRTSGSYVSWTDDEGETWEHSTVGKDTWDWPKILTGPAVSSKTEGYPNVVYFRAMYQRILGPLAKLYKSLDGGRTWAPTANLVTDGFEPGYGLVGPDGTIYMDEIYTLGFCSGWAGSPYPYKWREQSKLRIVISRDEGDTWEHVVMPEAFAPLSYYGLQRVAVDEENNLYVVWEDQRDGMPYLSISRDSSRTWSPRMMVGAPGLKHSHHFVSVVAREAGHIAICYYGSRQRFGAFVNANYTPDLRPCDGYLCETFNALDPDPVFYSATVNEPAEPLLPRVRISDGAGEGIGLAFDAQGAPWVTFTRVVNPFFPVGPAVFFEHLPTDLYVGRLMHPQAGR